jgi:hypothetical protein
MKKKILGLLLVINALYLTEILLPAQSTDCNVTVQFTTISTGLGYPPNNVLAVWVETGGGEFVRSLKVMANHNKSLLFTWLDASSGNVIDAITGATKTEHSPESIIWNCKDTSQVVVPDGDYKIIVEFTEEHAQGPLLEIPFKKNTVSSDSVFANAANFTNISINYILNSTKINDETLKYIGSFGVFPNPFSNSATINIWSDKTTDAHLSIYSVNGQFIKSLGNVKLTNGYNFFELNQENTGTELIKGIYLLRLEYDHEIKVTKLVKQ